MKLFNRYSDEDLAKIEKYEYKRGISYIKFGDRAYNRIVFCGFLIWLYMMTMVSFFVIGYILGINATGGINYVWSSFFIIMLVTSVVTVLTPFVYITAGIVGRLCKSFKAAPLLKISAIIVNAITVPILFVQFAMISLNDGVPLSTTTSRITDISEGVFGLKRVFYLRNGIPMLIVFLLCIVLIWLFIRQRLIMRREFKTIKLQSVNN